MTLLRALLAVFLLFIHGTGTSPAEERQEVRAVWITTAAGLDWPRSTDPKQQQDDLLDIITTLHREHFNTIYFQVRSRGDAYYRSTIEPWATNLTGSPGANPGWDPLAFLIEHAHAVGLEVHAWFNLYKVNGPGFPENSIPPHVARAKPHWVYSYEGELWLNPGIPEVNPYLSGIAMELIRNYDLDGIQFDFVRYPGKTIPDQAEYAAFGRGLPLAEWRRNNIDTFLQSFYREALAEKPWVKIGATPVGNFVAEGTLPGPTGYAEFYQNAPGWIREGSVDYIVPQIYWSLGESAADPDFALLARRWASVGIGRQVIAGIAPYKKEVLAELASQIDSARASGSAGQAFFRYRSLDFRALDGRYAEPANIPPMPWKDLDPPSPPQHLTVTEAGDHIYLLEWRRPKEAEGTGREYRYDVLRSSGETIEPDDTLSLISTTEAGIRFYNDTVRTGSGQTQWYAVRAIDRSGRTGSPSAAVAAVPKKLQSILNLLTPPPGLAATVDTESREILLAYRIPEPMAVTIFLQQNAGGTPNPLLETIVGELETEGTHVLRIGTNGYPSGDYFVIMKAGGASINRRITLP